MEPTTYTWLIPHRLAIAERPGGGGRSHRVARRIAEQDWWWEQGVRTIISGMTSRHGLLEYALAGFAVRWRPLSEGTDGRAALEDLADEVADAMEHSDDAVLVHCNRPGEWLAAVDAALRIRLGLCAGVADALEAVERDGLPVGSITVGLVSALGEDQQPQRAATR